MSYKSNMAQNFQDSTQTRQPHSTQIISVCRLLSVDVKDEKVIIVMQLY